MSGFCARFVGYYEFIQKVHSTDLQAFKGIVKKDLKMVLCGKKLKEGLILLEAWDGTSELMLQRKPNGPFVLLSIESWTPMLRD